MNSDLATLVLRAWTASPHSTIQRLDHRSLDVAWKTITSHLIFVLRHPAPPQLICLQAACTLDDILVIILRHLTTEPAISKPQCSAVFSTSSRSRLSSVAPPRAPTWTDVAWAWRLLTRSYRRWVTPYMSDGKLSSRFSAAFAGPRLPTPLRISFRPSQVRLVDVLRRSSTCRRKAYSALIKIVFQCMTLM